MTTEDHSEKPLAETPDGRVHEALPLASGRLHRGDPHYMDTRMTDENQFKRVSWDDEHNPSDDDDEHGMPLRAPGDAISAEDLELLTLAARALGAVQVEVVEGEQWVNLHMADGSVVYAWNPLLHGDDTFNLAVDTRMQITQRVDEVRIGHRSIPALYEPVGADRRFATKRAVTRAAAEIGKGM